MLKNITGGRYLIPEDNCHIESEKLSEIPDELKSSMYWVSYIDHEGHKVESEKQCYIKNFQVEESEASPGTTLGKTDLSYKIRIEEMPTAELRDWMFNDVVLTLWESRPRFEKQAGEEGEEPTEKVVIDPETEMPEVETFSKGIIKINLLNWLKRSPANPTYSASQKKSDK